MNRARRRHPPRPRHTSDRPTRRPSPPDTRADVRASEHHTSDARTSEHPTSDGLSLRAEAARAHRRTEAVQARAAHARAALTDALARRDAERRASLTRSRERALYALRADALLGVTEMPDAIRWTTA
jgi:hypothetical protein